MTYKDEHSHATESPKQSLLRRLAARRLLRAEAIYLLAMMLFTALALFAHFNNYFAWDLMVSRALQSMDSPAMFGFMRGVSIFGDKWIPWVLAGVTIILFLAFGHRSEAAGLLLSAGGGQFLNSLLKRIIARPRPSGDLVDVFRALKTQSFPSGHVTFYVCFFGFLFFASYALLPRGSLLRRVALVMTALPVLLVGLSRIFLGEHWPSDTIGAYLFSGMWLAFSLHFYRRWKERATFHPGANKAEDLESASE